VHELSTTIPAYLPLHLYSLWQRPSFTPWSCPLIHNLSNTNVSIGSCPAVIVRTMTSAQSIVYYNGWKHLAVDWEMEISNSDYTILRLTADGPWTDQRHHPLSRIVIIALALSPCYAQAFKKYYIHY
jgi:hypothetical protein